MMPPTIATLRQLAPYGDGRRGAGRGAGRDLTPVLAQARLEGGEIVLSWPGHDEFTKHIDTTTGDSSGASSRSDSVTGTDSATGTAGSGSATA